MAGFDLKAIQKMQEKMMQVQQQLANETVDGSAGGGGITITMNGHYKIMGVKIAVDLVDPKDVSMLEDLITVAAQDAFDKVIELQQKRLSSVTGGMKLPGMPGM